MQGELMNDPQNPEFQAWCRMVFSSLREGGVWGVPRSGLIFSKQDGKLVLTAEMPWMPLMEGTVTREVLWQQQAEDFEIVRAHFAAAGIVVEKAVVV